jgi:hypothetical protein
VNWPHGDPDAVMRAVLAQPAYRFIHAAPLAADKPSLSALILSWIVEHARDLLRPLREPMAGALRAGGPLGVIISFALVAGALAALGYGVFRLALAFARPAQTRGASHGSPIEARLSAAQWQRRAAEAAARMDYGRAIAALFGAALAVLDAHGLVPFDAARAPGEYCRLVRALRAPAAEPFEALTDRFVHAIYAAEPAHAADFEAATRAYRSLEPLLA